MCQRSGKLSYEDELFYIKEKFLLLGYKFLIYMNIHKIYPFLTDFHSTLVIGLQGLSFPSLPIWAENM